MNIQELQTGILDINNKYNIDFSCKQLDDIILKIIVYDKSVQADLSNYNCRLKAFKSDQVLLIQNTNISIKDNVVTIKASKQLTTTVGIVKAELQFINKTTLEKKSTFYINIEVVASVLDVDGTVSTPTCTILEEIDHKLDEIENISNVLEEAKEVRDELKGTTIPNATNINSNLEDNTNNANNKIIEVKNIISSASNKIEEVKTSIINATNTKDNLAATTKEKIEELKDAATLEKESIISTAFNKIKEVETCINNADSSKKELDLSKTNADISKENLDTANTLAEKNIEELNSLGNVTDLAKNVQTNTTDITKLKTDVEDNTSQLKDCAKNLSQLSNPNILINGDVQVWQRGEKFIPLGKKIYTSDRWITEINTGEVLRETLDEKDIPSSDCLVVKTLSDSSSIYTGIAQVLDKNEFGKTYNGKTMTVSFWYKTNKKATFQFWNGTSNIPVGNLDVIDKWTYKTVTFIFNNSTVNNFGLAFRPNTAKDSELQLTCVKLELGSVATPFIPRPYGEELALCKRYYKEFNGIMQCHSITGDTLNFNFRYGDMRTTPTVKFKDESFLDNNPGVYVATTNAVFTNGYTFTLSVNVYLNLIQMSATKTSHGKQAYEVTGRATSNCPICMDAEIY